MGDAQTPMRSARFPDAWIAKIEEMYSYWKKGQTIPDKGVPIAQWGVLSPAQRKRLTDMHILTVEQLAEATDEALDNFGMGGRQLQMRAKDYLKLNSGEATKVSAELQELRAKNESLERRLEAVLSKLEAASLQKEAA